MEASPALEPTAPRAVLEAIRRASRASAGQLCHLAETTAQLERDVARFGRLTTCPACRVPWLPVLFTAEHALACQAHPAAARARAAHEELTVVGRLAVSAGRPLREGIPPPPLPKRLPRGIRCWGRRGEPADGFPFALDEDVGDAFKVLGGDGTRRVHQQVLTSEQALEVLSIVVGEADAFAARRTSACPGCGGPVALDELAAHLMSCPRHPEAVRAAVLEDLLEQVRGPEPTQAGRLIRRRMALQTGVLQLAGASLAFLSGLSDCDIGKARIDETNEERWKRAQAEAAKLLRADS